MVGRKIASYQITESLGSGGLGVVYRARNLNLDRDSVLKLLPDAITQDPQAFDRACRVLRKAARLNHPNIGAIYEILREDNQWFIILELIKGQTLQEMLAESTLQVPPDDDSTRPPVSFQWYFEYVRRLLDAIEHAHSQGIIHLGIKPANIFLTRSGILKVSDFGVAALQYSSSGSASSNSQVNSGSSVRFAGNPLLLKAEPHRYAGWAAYLSPEQVLGEKLDERSDLFSLGAVIYEMATGRAPFAGKGGDWALAAIVNHTPRRPAEMTSELPLELDRIIGKALEKDAGARYQRVAEIRAEIERLLINTGSWRRGPIVG
jgi:eukaryotic-like serine/threonine-protein kinase